MMVEDICPWNEPPTLKNKKIILEVEVREYFGSWDSAELMLTTRDNKAVYFYFPLHTVWTCQEEPL